MHSQITPEIIKGMRDSSKIIHFDFANPLSKPMQDFFKSCSEKGINPKLPQNRQAFNEQMLNDLNLQVLIGQYAEDKSAILVGTKIAQEGRTIHLGVDLFTEKCVDVFAPYAGEIIDSGFEEGNASYGYYCIIDHRKYQKPFLTFYGHLSSLVEKKKVRAGEKFATLGNSEQNGGWSIHLHFQLLVEPMNKPNTTPIGYCSRKDFEAIHKKYPNPNTVLQIKELK